MSHAKGNANRETKETFNSSDGEDSEAPGGSQMDSHQNSSQLTAYNSKAQGKEPQRGKASRMSGAQGLPRDGEDDQEARTKGASPRKKQSKLPAINQKRAKRGKKGPPPPKVMEFTFTPERIMSKLSRQRLEALKNYWDLHADGLDCAEFAQLMLNHYYTADDDEKYELVHGCFTLFGQVDINGDGMMEWGEFMQYIIDAVSGNTIKGGDGQESVREQIARIKAKKYNRFQMALRPLDQSHHSNAIQQAMLCESSQAVVSFERYSKEIKFYDYNLNFKEKHKVPLRKPGFVTSIAYDEDNMIYGVASSDGCLHFYQKGKIKVDLLKTIVAPNIQMRIFYMKRQELWLTAGRDFKLRHWSIHKNGELLQELEIHTDEITDCIEIINPSCIATCSLDKTIVLFDVEHRVALSTMKESHEKGIRCLRYQALNGAIMISIGSEIYANVWAPESLVSDTNIGRLNGHKKSIVDGHFLNRAPYFVTIDVGNVLNFWDIQNLICIQRVASTFKFQAEGILVLSNNVFWAYGKRFFQFDTFQGDAEEEQVGFGAVSEGDYPICAYLNNYLLNIFVVKKHDVRMYDISKGKLQSLHNNIFQEESSKSEITKFKIDKRHRKAYVANSHGQIFVVNCQSGVIIKNVTQYLEDFKNLKGFGADQNHESMTSLGTSNHSDDDDAKKDRRQKEDGDSDGQKESPKKADDDEENGPSDQAKEKKLSNPEINDMHLIWEKEMIMMICSNSREYMVFDEDNPEESTLLRRVSGAHQEEITILAYDYHLSLVATGCINGEIALYDFEMSKIEGLLVGHQGDITAMEFLSPYPMLVSASMDFTVCIWGVRPCPTKYLNICIKRFLNTSWNHEKDAPCVVSRILLWSEQKAKGIKKYRRQKRNQMPATAYRKFEHNFVFGFKDMPQVFDEEFPPKKNQLVQFSEEYKLDKVVNGQLYQELLADEKSKTFLTQVQSVGADYNEQLDIEKERTYLYVGDEFGFLKIWDLTSFLETIDIQKCRSVTDMKAAFNPRRQETVDCSAFTIHQRNSFQQKPPTLPHLVNPELTGILIREAKSHVDVITSIAKMEFEDCKGVVTSSRDNKVRTWSINLDMWGNLNQRTDRDDLKWHLPTDQKKINREVELQKVEHLIDKLELDLEEERRKLVVDDNKIVKKVEVKAKSRANWFKIEEEKKERAQELQLKLERQKQQQRYKMEQGQLITQKIERLIKEQAVQFTMLEMTVPKKLPDGYSKYLQTLLNEEQAALMEETKAQPNEWDQSSIQPKHRRAQLKQSSVKLQPNQSQASVTTKMKGSFSKKTSRQQLSQTQPKSTLKKSGADDPDQQNSQTQLSRGQQSPTQSGAGQGSPLMQTSATKRNASLKKLMEDRPSKDAMKRFEDSKQDKGSIAELGQIPKIRNKLESLKKKDRFSTSPSLGDGLSMQGGLESYLDSQRFKARASIRNPHHQSILHSARPFSIADSEIQKVADFSGDGLTHEPSKSSIGYQDLNYQNLRRRQGRSDTRNQPQLHTLDAQRGSTISQAKMGKPGQGSPFGRNQYVSIQEQGENAYDQSQDRQQYQTIDARGRDPGANLQPLDGLQGRGLSNAAGSHLSPVAKNADAGSPPLVLPPVVQSSQSLAASPGPQYAAEKQAGKNLYSQVMLAPRMDKSPTAEQSAAALSVQRSGVALTHTRNGSSISLMSAADTKKINDLERLKSKYCGAAAHLLQESRHMKERLEQQRSTVDRLKKTQKLKTLGGR